MFSLAYNFYFKYITEKLIKLQIFLLYRFENLMNFNICGYMSTYYSHCESNFPALSKQINSNFHSEKRKHRPLAYRTALCCRVF